MDGVGRPSESSSEGASHRDDMHTPPRLDFGINGFYDAEQLENTRCFATEPTLPGGLSQRSDGGRMRFYGSDVVKDQRSPSIASRHGVRRASAAAQPPRPPALSGRNFQHRTGDGVPISARSNLSQNVVTPSSARFRPRNHSHVYQGQMLPHLNSSQAHVSAGYLAAGGPPGMPPPSPGSDRGSFAFGHFGSIMGGPGGTTPPFGLVSTQFRGSPMEHYSSDGQQGGFQYHLEPEMAHTHELLLDDDLIDIFVDVESLSDPDQLRTRLREAKVWLTNQAGLASSAEERADQLENLYASVLEQMNELQHSVEVEQAKALNHDVELSRQRQEAALLKNERDKLIGEKFYLEQLLESEKNRANSNATADESSRPLRSVDAEFIAKTTSQLNLAQMQLKEAEKDKLVLQDRFEKLEFDLATTKVKFAQLSDEKETLHKVNRYYVRHMEQCNPSLIINTMDKRRVFSLQPDDAERGLPAKQISGQLALPTKVQTPRGSPSKLGLRIRDLFGRASSSTSSMELNADGSPAAAPKSPTTESATPATPPPKDPKEEFTIEVGIFTAFDVEDSKTVAATSARRPSAALTGRRRSVQPTATRRRVSQAFGGGGSDGLSLEDGESLIGSPVSSNRRVQSYSRGGEGLSVDTRRQRMVRGAGESMDSSTDARSSRNERRGRLQARPGTSPPEHPTTTGDDQVADSPASDRPDSPQRGPPEMARPEDASPGRTPPKLPQRASGVTGRPRAGGTPPPASTVRGGLLGAGREERSAAAVAGSIHGGGSTMDGGTEVDQTSAATDDTNDGGVEGPPVSTGPPSAAAESKPIGHPNIGVPPPPAPFSVDAEGGGKAPHGGGGWWKIFGGGGTGKRGSHSRASGSATRKSIGSSGGAPWGGGKKGASNARGEEFSSLTSPNPATHAGAQQTPVGCAAGGASRAPPPLVGAAANPAATGGDGGKNSNGQWFWGSGGGSGRFTQTLALGFEASRSMRRKHQAGRAELRQASSLDRSVDRNARDEEGEAGPSPAAIVDGRGRLPRSASSFSSRSKSAGPSSLEQRSQSFHESPR